MAPVLYELGVTALAPGSPGGPFLLVAICLLALLSWLPFRSSDEWSTTAKVWFGLVVVLWFYLVLIENIHDFQSDAAAVFIPLTALLVWLKRPSRHDVWVAADAFVWAVVISSAIVLLLEVVGVIPSWYQLLGGYFLGLVPFDAGSHWLTLGHLLGLEGRWGGMLRDPNAIGPVGAFVMVYGFARSGINRVVFVSAGTIILVLSDSRAAYAAAAFGLLLLVLLPGWSSRWRRITPARVVAAVFGLLLGLRLVYDLVTNTAGTLTMTGRSGMWPEFLSLWPQSPMFGVGTAAISAAVKAGVLPEWAYTGHNQYVDSVVRYGVTGLALTIVLLALTLTITIGGARRGLGLGLAIVGATLLASAANFLVDWRYPSVVFSFLLITVALSSRPLPKVSRR